jgi:hypothetical protein
MPKSNPYGIFGDISDELHEDPDTILQDALAAMQEAFKDMESDFPDEGTIEGDFA